MEALQPRYSLEGFARRGDDFLDRIIQPLLKPEDVGKYVLIDIDSGDFEVDEDEIVASDRLLARQPEAQVWMVRVGSRYARTFSAQVPVRTPFAS
jgi:hypothetical protein